jgi:hypothetical protein
MGLERRIKRLEWTNRFLVVLWLMAIAGGGIGYGAGADLSFQVCAAEPQFKLRPQGLFRTPS